MCDEITLDDDGWIYKNVVDASISEKRDALELNSTYDVSVLLGNVSMVDKKLKELCRSVLTELYNGGEL